jgi:hypothetical protein
MGRVRQIINELGIAKIETTHNFKNTLNPITLSIKWSEEYDA